MRSFRHALAGPAALAFALSAGFAAVVLAPAAAVAQTATGVPRSIAETMAIGTYQSRSNSTTYNWAIKRESSGKIRLTGERVVDGRGVLAAYAFLQTTPNGTLEGDLYTPKDGGVTGTGRVKLDFNVGSPVRDLVVTGLDADARAAMNEFGDGNAVLTRQVLQIDTEPFVPWVGSWATSSGTLTFTAPKRAAWIEGVLQVKNREGIPITRRRFALRPDGAGRMVGAWANPVEEGYGGGDAEFTPGADGKTFTARFGQTNTSDPTLSGKKTATGEVEGQYRPPVTQGDWHPKPGYLACAGWCRLKVVGSEVKVFANNSGGYWPMLMFRIAVHNATELEHTLAPDGYGNVPANAVRIYANVAGTKTTSYSNGPVKPGDGFEAIRSMSTARPVTLPPGAEAVAEYWFISVPDKADGLTIEVGGEYANSGRVAGTIDAKAAFCAFYKKVAEMKASGEFQGSSEWGPVPESCGAAPTGTGSGSGSGSGSGATGAPSTSSTGSGPAPAPAPTPAPGGSAAGGASAPAADEFKPLWKYAVKVESVDVRDDQRIQVVAMLKNKTQAPLYLTSGALMVSVVDPDGVAQQTGQFVRATGEPPVLFNATPVIQPGATIRVRYLFRPNGEDRPSKVTFTEGSRTAEFAGQ